MRFLRKITSFYNSTKREKVSEAIRGYFTMSASFAMTVTGVVKGVNRKCRSPLDEGVLGESGGGGVSEIGDRGSHGRPGP